MASETGASAAAGGDGADHEAIPDFLTGPNVWILAAAVAVVVVVVAAAWKYGDRRFAQIIPMPTPTAVEKEEEEEAQDDAFASL